VLYLGDGLTLYSVTMTGYRTLSEQYTVVTEKSIDATP